MTRVAAIDCGTNAVRLLVADLDPATGTSVVHVRRSRIVRLGEGVDRSGVLAESALARVFAALEEYAAVVAGHDVEALRVGATSAARDAANAEVFLRGVEERLGVRPDIVTGAEEATLTFTGAVRGLDAATPAPVLVVDVGGGSTEVVLGSADGTVAAGASLDVGSVRMTERHLHSDPPAAGEVEAARLEVDAALDTLAARGVDPSAARTVVAVSGTGLTVAAGVLAGAVDGGRPRSLDDVDGAVVPVDGVRAYVARLLTLTVAERRPLPGMEAGRVDVIGAGGLILERALDRTRVSAVRASVADILDGLAWSALKPAPPRPPCGRTSR